MVILKTSNFGTAQHSKGGRSIPKKTFKILNLRKIYGKIDLFYLSKYTENYPGTKTVEIINSKKMC